jgi:ketosteroid isomerase-like protein
MLFQSLPGLQTKTRLRIFNLPLYSRLLLKRQIMKSRIFLVLATVSFFSCQSESDNHLKKEELKVLLSDYYNAMSKKDLDKMRSLTTPDFVMYDEGIIYNNESALKAIERTGPFTATFAFDSVNAHLDKANASAYYLREATFIIQDSAYAPMKFLESATFKKEGGKWRLRFIHSSARK